MSMSLTFVREAARNPNPDTSPLEGAPADAVQRGSGADGPSQEIDLAQLDIDKEELLDRFIGWFKASRDHYQEARQESEEAFDFVAGHQWTDEDMEVLREQSRPAVTFNRVSPFVDGVSGLEISNRQTTQYLPRQVGQSAVNELLTGAGQWARDECDAEDEESEAFKDAIICGEGWCLSDDTPVRLPDTHFATSRAYSGDVIHIHLEDGKKLTGTPNHPVLTDMGWKPLYALREGDNLINAAFLEGVEGFPIEQFDQVEARLEDKISAFRRGRAAVSWPTAANDFYTDGVGSEVHVVYADRALLDEVRKSALNHRLKQASLVGRDLLAKGCTLLSRLCLGEGALLTAESGPAVCVGHAPNRHASCDSILAQPKAALPQTARHGLGGNIVKARDFLGRSVLLEIEPCQLGDGCDQLPGAAAMPGSKDVAGRPKAVDDNVFRYGQFIRDFLDWKPVLEIQARHLCSRGAILPKFVTRVQCRVVERVADFMVHDVGTSTGMFLAAGIITSNTQTRMDYDDDPDGMIKIDRVDRMEMYPDASSRKPNYADAQHLIRVKDIPVERAERMFPNEATVDLHAQWAEDRPDETRSPHNARLAPYYRIDQAGQIDRQTLQCRLVEVEWWDYVTAWRVLDPRTGRFVRLTEKQYRTLEMRAMMIGYRPFKIKDRQKRYYKALVGNVVLRVMRGPDDGGFSYKAITAKRDRNRGTWYGLVRGMKDPQMWANKFFTQSLHIVNVNAKGGLLAETDAFVDIEEAREDWASADSITELQSGGLDKVRQKEVPNFPVQINQMMQQAMEAIPATAGINLEMIAQQSAQQSGVLEWQRKQQGMTVLAYAFNAKRRYQKEQGRLMLWMITTFIADGRLIRIGGPENAKYVPLVHKAGLAEYDVIVDDAPTSPNQKERVWSMIMQMFPMLRTMPLPPQGLVELMRYSPFPAALVEKIASLASQQAQQPPMSPEVQSRMNLDQAKAQHLQAQAQRTIAEARTIPQEAASEATERQARIEQMRANAAAALAKAGIDARDSRFNMLMDAVDALLQSQQQGHDQRMDITGQAHDQAMDRAGHALGVAQHGLDVYQAMNPPAPGGNAGNSGAQQAS